MKRETKSTAWFSFSDGSLRCDTVGPLTVDDYNAIWNSLPTTGCAWVECGNMFVQQCDGAIAYNLGPVEVRS
jgi:hypothetical protein